MTEEACPELDRLALEGIANIQPILHFLSNTEPIIATSNPSDFPFVPLQSPFRCKSSTSQQQPTDEFRDFRIHLAHSVGFTLLQIVRAGELQDIISPSPPLPARTSPAVSPPLLPEKRDQRSNFEWTNLTSSNPSLQHVSFISFVEHLAGYCPCSLEVWVFSLALIDRLLCSPNGFLLKLTRKNIHRLFSAAFVLSSKFCDDIFYLNSSYANLCGLDLIDINTFEREFLTSIDFNLLVDPITFQSYQKPLFALSQLQQRYGDLSIHIRGLIRGLRLKHYQLALENQFIVPFEIAKIS